MQKTKNSTDKREIEEILQFHQRFTKVQQKKE